VIRRLGIPVIHQGAYAYDAASVEAYIGYLKSFDLNPGALPTGKRVSDQFNFNKIRVF
jgi:hypothetical protein